MSANALLLERVSVMLSAIFGDELLNFGDGGYFGIKLLLPMENFEVQSQRKDVFNNVDLLERLSINDFHSQLSEF
jgi:hypothetical protein